MFLCVKLLVSLLFYLVEKLNEKPHNLPFCSSAKLALPDHSILGFKMRQSHKYIRGVICLFVLFCFSPGVFSIFLGGKLGMWQHRLLASGCNSGLGSAYGVCPSEHLAKFTSTGVSQMSPDLLTHEFPGQKAGTLFSQGPQEPFWVWQGWETLVHSFLLLAGTGVPDLGLVCGGWLGRVVCVAFCFCLARTVLS